MNSSSVYVTEIKRSPPTGFLSIDHATRRGRLIAKRDDDVNKSREAPLIKVRARTRQERETRALTLPTFIPTTCSFLLDLHPPEDENILIDIPFSADSISPARFIRKRIFLQCARTHRSTLIRKIAIYFDYFLYYRPGRISISANYSRILNLKNLKRLRYLFFVL